MFSGLQVLEALGSNWEGSQRTATFLSNRGAMDYQLGNYQSSPAQNGTNPNFVSQNGSDYQTPNFGMLRQCFSDAPIKTLPLILT